MENLISIENAIIESGILENLKSSQELYIHLKKIADKLYLKDQAKCVSDLCTTSLSFNEELSNIDIHELQDVAEDLCFYISQAVDNGLCNKLLEKIRNYFSYVNMVIEFNKDSSVVAITIKQFYYLVYEYRESFLNLESNQIELLMGFVNDFKHWVHLTFIIKNISPHSLDDSILSNYQMIENMILNLDNSFESSSLDDIFDF